MEITESQINCIVGEVMARMQRNEDTAGMHGIFADMDTAIERAKDAQKFVRSMSCP